MTTTPVRLLASADEGYAMQLAVMLRSAGEQARAAPLQAHLLHDAIPKGTRARVEASVSDLPLTIVWHQVDPKALPASVNLEGYSGVPATYFRLLFERFVPQDIERIIYLDLDLLVRRDLSDLAAQPFAGTVAAVRIKPTLATMIGFELEEAPNAAARPAFNAGVMLIDTARWREEGVGLRSLELAGRYGGRFRHVDQDALNVALSGAWDPLSPEWNVRPDPFGFPSWGPDDGGPSHRDIVHFAGRAKPWHSVSDWAETGLWFEFLDRTDWAGWRPPRLNVAARIWEVGVERGHRRVDRLREICLKASRSQTPHALHRRLLAVEYAKRPWMLLTYPLSRRGRPVY